MWKVTPLTFDLLVRGWGCAAVRGEGWQASGGPRSVYYVKLKLGEINSRVPDCDQPRGLILPISVQTLSKGSKFCKQPLHKSRVWGR